MSSKSRHLARRNAVQALYQWDLTEQDPSDIEDSFIEGHDLSKVDLEYFRHLIRNVPLYHLEIDDRLSQYIKRDLDNIDPVERAILRLGTYELEFEKTIPYKAIIDEAIELTKLFGSEEGYRFVNGVLDRLAKELRHSEIGSS